MAPSGDPSSLRMTDITADQMGRAVIRLPAAIFIPAVVLAAAWAAATFSEHIPAGVDALLTYLPYVLAIGAAVLGWRFNRSRLVFSVIAVAIGHWLLQGPASEIKPGSAGEAGYIGFATLFPLGLVALALLKERGLLSRHGITRALIFAGAAGVVTAIAMADLWLASDVALTVRGEFVAALSTTILPAAWTGWTEFPHPALILFALATGFLIVRLILLDNPPLESGALGALLAIAAALHFAGDSLATTLFSSAAALILVVAVVQDTYRLAFLDELTGLPGRRALMMDSMKLGQRFTIAMLDVDHFKKFNDTYGHDVGDQVLRMIASRMKRVNGGGKSFRYGGEEFTVLFPGKTRDESLPHLENLRESIADTGFVLRGRDRPRKKPVPPKTPKKKTKTISVTISIGAAERSDKLPSADAVIREADKALYRAKKAGRNQVSV